MLCGNIILPGDCLKGSGVADILAGQIRENIGQLPEKLDGGKLLVQRLPCKV
jgi:hypothetical protein